MVATQIVDDAVIEYADGCAPQSASALAVGSKDMPQMLIRPTGKAKGKAAGGKPRAKSKGKANACNDGDLPSDKKRRRRGPLSAGDLNERTVAEQGRRVFTIEEMQEKTKHNERMLDISKS